MTQLYLTDGYGTIPAVLSPSDSAPSSTTSEPRADTIEDKDYDILFGGAGGDFDRYISPEPFNGSYLIVHVPKSR